MGLPQVHVGQHAQQPVVDGLGLGEGTPARGDRLVVLGGAVEPRARVQRNPALAAPIVQRLGQCLRLLKDGADPVEFAQEP